MRIGGGWRVMLAGLAFAGNIATGEAGEVQPPSTVTADALPVPRIFYTRQGEFEIIVQDAADAQPALALGRTVWSVLSVPLGLPADGFSSPVSVRLVPATQWSEPSPFTVIVEPPGRVIVRVRWDKDVDPIIVRRAFVQGLILRQAVAWHGVGPQLTVPLWLEHACTAWSLVRERPALLDEFQQESAALTAVPTLRALLSWQRGEVESRGWELSSLWLFSQLQAEATEPARWGGWVRSVVGGAAAFDSLPRSYRGLWTDAAGMEMWWQVSFRYQSRLRTIPVMTTEASRVWLADRSRWLGGRQGREVVLSLDELLELRKEPWVRAELTERVKQAQSILGVIHPFYVNATLSMGRLYEAALKGKPDLFKTARADFERDAIDGRELDDTVNAILDTAPRK